MCPQLGVLARDHGRVVKGVGPRCLMDFTLVLRSSANRAWLVRRECQESSVSWIASGCELDVDVLCDDVSLTLACKVGWTIRRKAKTGMLTVVGGGDDGEWRIGRS